MGAFVFMRMVLKKLLDGWGTPMTPPPLKETQNEWWQYFCKWQFCLCIVLDDWPPSGIHTDISLFLFTFLVYLNFVLFYIFNSLLSTLLPSYCCTWATYAAVKAQRTHLFCLHHESKPSVSEPSSDRIIIIVKIIWRKKCTTSHKFDSRKFGYLQMVFLANTYLWFLVYLILLSWVSQSMWTSQLGLGVLYIFRLFTELFFLSLFFICFL